MQNCTRTHCEHTWFSFDFLVREDGVSFTSHDKMRDWLYLSGLPLLVFPRPIMQTADTRLRERSPWNDTCALDLLPQLL